MQVNYGGKVDISTIDWYGRASTVIFLRGCQLRCGYCHNYSLVEESRYEDISVLKAHLKEASMLVGCVVFCGGEPTLQPEALGELAGYAKKLGLDVGVNTNGLRAEVISELKAEGLLDFVTIDAKAPLESPDAYGRVCAPDASPKAQRELGERWCALVRESLKLLDGSVEAEVRTTVFPELLSPQDVEDIARWLAENHVVAKYVLQEGMPVPKRFPYPSPTKEQMEEYARRALVHLNEVSVRTAKDGDQVMRA